MISFKDGRINALSLLKTLDKYLKHKKVNHLQGEIIKIRKSKNRFSLFISISYSNNNNFSFIPFPSKSSIYESRIDRWINYCCNKGTKINNLIKET